eukprot:scaffold14529_cov117-Isochrysis_galbana.AAC.9
MSASAEREWKGGDEAAGNGARAQGRGDNEVGGSLRPSDPQDVSQGLHLPKLVMRAPVNTSEKRARRPAAAHLHRGDVGVDQDDLKPLLLERLDGLRARVVKLARLPNGQAARTEQQHLGQGLGLGLNVHAERECLGQRRARVGHGAEEEVEQEGGVRRAGLGLRVELRRDPRPLRVHDALVGAVVPVLEDGNPALGQLGDIKGVTVVLRGDEAAPVDQVNHRLVLPAVTEGQLVRGGAGRHAQQLVAEADAKQGLHLDLARLHRLDGLLEVLHRLRGHGRIARPVGQEQAIGVLEPVLERGVPRHKSHLAVALEKRADDVVLDPAISGENLVLAALVEDAGLLDGHLGHQVALVHILEAGRDLRPAQRHRRLKLDCGPEGAL